MRIHYFILVVCLAISCKHSARKAGKSEPKSGQYSSTYAYICNAKTADNDWYSSGTKAPKFKGLDGIDFKISTSSTEAQEYFNQGMMLSYGFNHAEAARSFFEATRIDSTCAMAWWGYAYVLGPNYNAGMEEGHFERAYAASQKALALSDNCTQREKALIRALTSRYALNPPKDRNPLDIAYYREMKKVYEKFPSDPDVGALYAEALMDLHPWDLYDKKTKAPKEWTPELLTVLEHLIKINPKHPGAHHFYIHAVEASANPEKGLASADLLLTLVPGAGHLVHMPAHIYINTGDYHRGSLANIKAVKVDSNYVTACHAQGAYPLAYFPHNYHFLAATATLEGASKLAWEAAREIQMHTAQEIMTQPGWGTLQHYYAIPYYVAVKFAMWDTILAVPVPEESLVYPRAVLHYARGMAYLGKKDLASAEKENALLKELSEDSVLKATTIWNVNSTYDLMQIALKVLSAEIFNQKRLYDQAIPLFQEAVAIEDKLNYNEPPDWFFSVRHHLGEALLNAEKYAEAEKVYQEDLKTFRENGWALTGLFASLMKQGKNEEAAKVKMRMDKAFEFADLKIDSSSSL